MLSLYIEMSRLQLLALKQMGLPPNYSETLMFTLGESLCVLRALLHAHYVRLRKLPFPRHHLKLTFF